MPRAKTMKKAKKKCSTCRKSFALTTLYKDHVPCHKTKVKLTKPCRRCQQQFDSKKSYMAHKRKCDLKCRLGCGAAKFKTLARTLEHERHADCTAKVRQSDLEAVVVPPNVHSVTLEDLDGIFTPGLEDCQQQQLQATDSCIDAFLAMLSEEYPRFAAITAAQCELFAQLGPELQSDSSEKVAFAPGVELVAMPCRLRHEHWSLLIYNVHTNESTVYDSMFKASKEVKKLAVNMLKAHSQFFDVPEVDETKIYFAKGTIQDQDRNTQNCGLHAIYYAEQLAKNEAFEKGKDMVQFRQRVRALVLHQIGGHVGNLKI